MVGIGQQQHRGMARRGLDDLAHQPAGIDHRLAHVHAIAAARIQHQALAHRIQVDVQDRRQLHIQATAFGRPQQRAQLRVVGGGGLQPGQARIGDQQLIAQVAVFVGQLGAGAGILLHARAQPSRQSGQPPQRLGGDIGLHAQLRQPAAAMVEEDQGNGQGQVAQQPERAGHFAWTCGDGRAGVGRHLGEERVERSEERGKRGTSRGKYRSLTTMVEASRRRCGSGHAARSGVTGVETTCGGGCPYSFLTPLHSFLPSLRREELVAMHVHQF